MDRAHTGEGQVSAPALSLYALADEYQAIEQALIESGGELTPEIEAALDALDDALEDKVERIVHVIQSKQRTADMAKLEATRLSELARTRANGADSLRRYLMAQLQRAGKTRVDTPTAIVTVQRNSRPSIAWTGEGDPPEEYRRVRIEPDTEGVYRTWKASGGEILPDGFTMTTGLHLRIR